MKRILIAIINNDNSPYYIILFFIAVSLLFSCLYYVALPFLDGHPALKHSRYGAAGAAYITYLDCFYFSVTTQTTVGYGDIVPASAPGKICSIIQAVFGYFYLAFSISIFACKGIIRSRKFELLLQSYRRDIKGINEYIANN
ncbi:MAG TPA: potassium channel family protein [Syntrophorhabdaceae bacterium]|nr:potassium channel family protein [Syntrophorhabdaceae bacterium]HQM81886.1 potassium channel family protein [Syntrophorhabdaceae bacterium]